MPGAQVEDGVDGVETQAVEVELLQPHPRVVEHEVADRVATVPVEVDGGAPRGRVPVVEVSAELGQVVPLRAEVVVDDVEEDREPRGMASIDQPLQAVADRRRCSVPRRAARRRSPSCGRPETDRPA